MKTIEHSLRNSAVSLAFAGIILLMVWGCTDSNNGPSGPGGDPPANEIFIQSMAFNPASLIVTAGTTVKWTNKDGIIHNVTSNTGVFSSGSIPDNGTFSYTFSTAGTYQYHCTIHPSMTATVVVTN